jgi:hypothetical protein
MLAELERLATDAELTAWAKDGLPRKNQLVEADARTIEIGYPRRLSGMVPPLQPNSTEPSSQACKARPPIRPTPQCRVSP